MDFKWTTEKKKIVAFSINVSILEDENSTDVYRIDTSHGYMHEHRFWKSLKPEMIDMNYNRAFIEKKNEVIKNYARWIMLFKKARGEEYGQNR